MSNKKVGYSSWEDEQIIEIHNSITELDSYLVNWFITLNCNQHCSYCLRKSNEYYSDSETEELAIECAKNLKYLFDAIPQSKIKLSFNGGEPTKYDLHKVLSYADLTKVSDVSLVTNFTRPIEYFVDLEEYLHKNNINFNLTTSYHEVFSYDEWIAKYHLLKDSLKYDTTYHKTAIILDENLTHKKLAEELVAEGCLIKFNFLREPANSKQVIVSEENIKWLRQMLNLQHSKKPFPNVIKVTLASGKTLYFDNVYDARASLVLGGISTFDYWCSAGKYSCRIGPDGTISRGACKYFQQFRSKMNLLQPETIKPFLKDVHCYLDEDKYCIIDERINLRKDK